MGDPERFADAILQRKSAFARAVRNLTGHHKRSMLDFIDLRYAQIDPGDRHTRELLDVMKRRVHNELSLYGDQIMAAFEIFVNEGVIPAFGREDAQTRVVPAAVAARNGHPEPVCPPR